jgi:signal transduction histidine kinase/ligand-binding sensor domain-containing protein
MSKLLHRNLRPGHRSVTLYLGLLLFLSLPTRAWTLDPLQPLKQMHHTSWTAKDGLIGSVLALAQTNDGFLWIGTDHGLFSFDGVTFRRFEPAAEDATPLAVRAFKDSVTALKASPDGGLWIGYSSGGITYLKAGRITDFGLNQRGTMGFLGSPIHAIALSHEGTLWAANSRGVGYRLAGAWHVVPFDPFRGSMESDALLFDREGTLWASAADRILVLRKGHTTFQDTGIRANQVPSLAEAPDGTIWFVDGHHVRCYRPGHPDPENALQPERSFAQILFDSHGTLWIANDEVTRVATAWRSRASLGSGEPGTESLTHTDGLTSSLAQAVLEDLEGNIWIGTQGGLDRFRHRNLSWLPLGPGEHSFSLAEGLHGDVWAWARYTTPRSPHAERVQDGALLNQGPATVRLTYRPPSGTVYLATNVALWKWDGVTFSRIAALPPEYDPQVTALAETSVGKLWISTMRNNALSFTPSQGWQYWEIFPENPHSRANSAYVDRDDVVWMTFPYGGVVSFDGHGQHIYPVEEAFALGSLHKVVGRGSEIWIAGKAGLAFLNGSQFHMLSVDGSTQLGAIYEVVPTPADGLWLSTESGIIHLPEAEIQAAMIKPDHRVSYSQFDLVSDLPEQLQDDGSSGAIRTQDGLLWFATTNGVMRIDPSHIVINRIPPPVSIHAVTADGISYSPYQDIRLPALAKNLRFDYTALSLTIPERVRFRYKLEGLDKDWQDAGTRRQAFYTNLAPGRYTFHVLACNNDGVWNETGARLNIYLRPAFFQTYWFIALSGALCVALVWLLYRRRVHYEIAQVERNLNARLEERARISRELHDTLLQGFQGLAFRLGTIMKHLPSGDRAVKEMADALDRADDVLVEGRRRVRDLRSTSVNEQSLSKVLEAYLEDASQHSRIRWSVEVEGSSRSLDTIVSDEVYYIAKEALTNAFQHSKASTILVKLIYDPTRFRLVVQDDGIGIPKALIQVGKENHWGLAMMRERAGGIGGTLEISNLQEPGTKVELRIPSRIAYARVP